MPVPALRPLTAAEVQFFRHQGYLRLPGGLPLSLVKALRRHIADDLAAAVEPVVRNAAGRAVRLSDVWSRGEPYRDAIRHEAILTPLASLLGENIELILNRHNHATSRPGPTAGLEWHRDGLQWSRTIATVIVYLEESTVETGATLVLPGSHLWPPTTGLHNPDAHATQGLLDQALPLPMPAGGLAVIDSMIFHSPGLNRTAGTRMSLTAGYHSVDELAPGLLPNRVLVRGAHIDRSNRPAAAADANLDAYAQAIR